MGASRSISSGSWTVCFTPLPSLHFTVTPPRGRRAQRGIGRVPPSPSDAPSLKPVVEKSRSSAVLHLTPERKAPQNHSLSKCHSIKNFVNNCSAGTLGTNPLSTCLLMPPCIALDPAEFSQKYKNKKLPSFCADVVFLGNNKVRL